MDFRYTKLIKSPCPCACAGSPAVKTPQESASEPLRVSTAANCGKCFYSRAAGTGARANVFTRASFLKKLDKTRPQTIKSSHERKYRHDAYFTAKPSGEF